MFNNCYFVPVIQFDFYVPVSSLAGNCTFTVGRLTDNKGRTVDFKNTIIIMTSNVGATEASRTPALGFTGSKQAEYDKMCDK